MKLEDLTFTDKQAKRILAEAAEREARDYEDEIEGGQRISYPQLVEIAREAQINPRYLKVSTKQMVAEVGGLERAAVVNTANVVGNVVKDAGKLFTGGLFYVPTMIRGFREYEKGDGHGLVSFFYTLIANSLSIAFVYPKLFENNLTLGLAALSVHLGTNLASGLYETYRYQKNKLIEEMNGEESDSN